MRRSMNDNLLEKPSTSYTRTRHSLATSSKNPGSACDFTTPSHPHSSSLKTRITNNKRKRRSGAEHSAARYLYSEPPARCVTPKRSRAATATAQTTIEDKFKEILNNCEEDEENLHVKGRDIQQSKMSNYRSEQGQAIDESLAEIDREKEFHKKVMEVITRKFVDRFPEKKQKLRDLCKIEKFYTENTYEPKNQKVPQYLEYCSSFYSRSRRKCYREVTGFQEFHSDIKNNPIQDEKDCFSYLQYVADLKAKKRFEKSAKTKISYDGMGLLKSKEKILGFWKNGTNGREKIKVLIDQILKEKRRT